MKENTLTTHELAQRYSLTALAKARQMPCNADKGSSRYPCVIGNFVQALESFVPGVEQAIGCGLYWWPSTYQATDLLVFLNPRLSRSHAESFARLIIQSNDLQEDTKSAFKSLEKALTHKKEQQ